MLKKCFFLLISLVSQIAVAQRPLVLTTFETFGDHIFIKLSVDGSRPLDFIFDTGDGLTVIDTEVAIDLKLPLNHKSTKKSAHGVVEGSLIVHNYLEMAGVRLEDDIKLYATSLKHLERSIGRNIDGIIGYDLLQHYAVELDELNHKFRLFQGDTYKYLSIGDKYEMDLEKSIPYVTATIKLSETESITGPFFVVTGAGTTLDFNTKFAEKNDILNKTGDHYSYLVKGIGSNENIHYEGRIQQLQLGKIKFDNLPVGISTAKKGVQANKKMYGVIGNRLLKNFTVIFDYHNKAMYLERFSNTVTDFHVNACGFEIQLAEDQSSVLVHRVYEKGPAITAGLNVNDQIVSINGNPVKGYTLPALNEILNKEGTTVELVIKRGEDELTVVLDLKELL